MQVIQNLALYTGSSLEEAVHAMTAVPADILQIGDRKGRIAVGYDADLILFDKNFNLQQTMIAGEITYDYRQPSF